MLEAYNKNLADQGIVEAEFSTSTYNQIAVLMHRVLVRAGRNRNTVLIVPLARHLIIGTFYGTVFYQLPTGNDVADYTERLALFFFSLMFVIMGHQQTIPALQEERLIFYRERGSNAYGAFPYWFACWFLMIPTTCINVLLYSVLLYTLSGLRPGLKYFGIFYLAMLLSSYCGLFVCQVDMLNPILHFFCSLLVLTCIIINITAAHASWFRRWLRRYSRPCLSFPWFSFSRARFRASWWVK